MEDDTTPRLATVPRPTDKGVTTPKHTVPEVSLVCDSEDSITWHTAQPTLKADKKQLFQSNVKKVRIDTSTVNPQVPPVRSLTCANRSAERSPCLAPSTSVLAHTRAERDTLAERNLQVAQDTASPYVHPAVTHHHHHSGEYNPQVYSPVPKHTTREASSSSQAQGVLQRHSHSTSNVITTQNLSSPTTENSVPLHPRVIQTTLSSQYVSSGPVTLPRTARPDRQDDFVYSPFGNVTSINRTPIPPVAHNKTQNQFCANPSSPAVQQARLATNLQSYGPHTVGYGDRQWPSPSSSSLPVLPPNKYGHQEKDFFVGQTWGHPEPLGYSPNTIGSRLHSPADPMVYCLIEDQNQQIKKLTKDLQKIMERQENDTADYTSEKVNSTARGTKVKDRPVTHASTQTKDSDAPATRTVGVNTDITWSALVASIRGSNQVEAVEQRAQHSGRRCNLEAQSRNVSWDAPVDYAQLPDCHTRLTLEQDCGNSASPIPNSHQPEERNGSTSEQEPKTSSHPPLSTSVPLGCTVPPRGDQGERQRSSMTEDSASSLLVGDSASSPTPPLPPPSGTTFYNNVMTNIQQILQHASSPQEQESPQENLPTQSARGGSSSEEPDTDPQIEAVRKQLLNFGVSFLDPATLAHRHRTVMDSLYLPGMHNMVSLYQSTVSTHYQPHGDTMTAKYLTDPQLAAIAASSPAMAQKSPGFQQPAPSMPPNSTYQHHLHKYPVNSNTDDNVSLTTRRFLKKYGLQED